MFSWSTKRTRPRAVFILLVVSLAAMTLSARAERVQEEEHLPSARQNPILRDFYREIYPTNRAHPPAENFLESFIDRQIDAFLAEIEKKIRELDSSYEVATHLRDQLSNLTVSDLKYREVRAGFGAAMENVAKRSDALADQLSMVFRGLKRDKDLSVQIREAAEDDAFRMEVQFIGRQIVEGKRLVHDYLFLSTNLVKLEDLGGENMLVRLDWAEEMAKRLAKLLK